MLLIKSHLNLSLWVLWCKCVTVQSQIGWKPFLFDNHITHTILTICEIIASYLLWSSSSLLWGRGQCVGALLGYSTHPLRRGLVLLIVLKGKLVTGKVNSFAYRWTESLQLNQELKPTQDWICQYKQLFLSIYSLCAHVTFYDMFLRDSCFFKHLLTETINHNCTGEELLTLKFASKNPALSLVV